MLCTRKYAELEDIDIREVLDPAVPYIESYGDL